MAAAPSGRSVVDIAVTRYRADIVAVLSGRVRSRTRSPSSNAVPGVSGPNAAARSGARLTRTLAPPAGHVESSGFSGVSDADAGADSTPALAIRGHRHRTT